MMRERPHLMCGLRLAEVLLAPFLLLSHETRALCLNLIKQAGPPLKRRMELNTGVPTYVLKIKQHKKSTKYH